VPNRKQPRYKFVKAWAWPDGVEKHVGSLIEGYSLHVCCGESKIGDVRIDLTKQADVKADMFHLPIRNASFDTVICDPPWKLGYHRRYKLLYQLRDALKPGGLLIFNAFWYPRTRGLVVEEQMYVGLVKAAWRNVSLLILARREALS
jgi:hypothetical protein